MQKRKFSAKSNARPPDVNPGLRRMFPTEFENSVKPQSPITTAAFHGGTGGAGATLLAAETAAALAAGGLSVAAVDFDLYRGCLNYRLDVPLARDTFTVVDVLPVLEDPTERALDNALSRCPCGARLMPAPSTPERAGLVTPEHVRALINALTQSFDLVVIDTPAMLDEVTAEAIRQSDLVMLVVTPELSSLGGAKRALETLTMLGVAHSKMAVVVNRSFGNSDAVSPKDIESFLGLGPFVVLPDESERCRRIADEGRFLFLEKSQLGQGVQEMIRRLLNSPSIEAAARS